MFDHPFPRSRALCSLLFFILVAVSDTKAAEPSLDAMLGQMVMVGFRGTGEEPLVRDLENLSRDIEEGKIGGVILFEPDYLTRGVRNIVSIEQTRRLADLLQSRAAIPLFVAVDQEGGRVRRFTPGHGVPATPSARDMGMGEPDTTFEEGSRLGAALARAGVNLDFAPVVDVDVNPDSPAIGRLGRSFSADPRAVADHARAFARGLWSRGVLPCYKHFPGHGSAAADSHAGFTDISATWKEDELPPYRALLSGKPPAMVMVGHLSLDRFDAVHPSSLSKAIIDGVLRRDLGWDGVVITDDLQMQAIRDNYGEKEALALAVNAGVDIILVGNNLVHDPETGRKVFALLRELVAEGAIAEARVRQSYRRIMRLKDAIFRAGLPGAAG